MEFIVKRKSSSDSELKHYGIKGQIWGVRNYQYEDGSYTPAGKKRYSENRGSSKRSAAPKTRNMTRNVPVSRASQKLSNEQLAAITAKKLSDEQLAELTAQSQQNKLIEDRVKEELARKLKDKGITVDPSKVSKEYLMEMASNSGIDVSAVSRIEGLAKTHETTPTNASTEYQKELEYNSKKNVYPEGDLRNGSPDDGLTRTKDMYTITERTLEPKKNEKINWDKVEKEMDLLRNVKDKIAETEAASADTSSKNTKSAITKPVDEVRRRSELAQYEEDKQHPQKAMARKEALDTIKREKATKEAVDATIARQLENAKAKQERKETSRRSKTSEGSSRKSMMQSDRNVFYISRDGDPELQHYGIKGQEWGKRHYQYEDGSLTPAGKERYKKDGLGKKINDALTKARETINNNLSLRKKNGDTTYTPGYSQLSEEDRKKAIKDGDFSAWSGGHKSNKPDHRKAATYQEIREELSLKELQDLLTVAFDEDTLKSDVAPNYWPYQLNDDLKFTVTDEEKQMSEYLHVENERIMWNNMIDELKSSNEYKDQLEDLEHKLKYAQISYEMFYGEPSAPVLRPNGSLDMYQDSHQLPMSKQERESLIEEWKRNNPDPKQYRYPYDRMKVSKDYSNNSARHCELINGVYYIFDSSQVDELKHYGILGMKWGVRRYQNEDGSLTSAGRKRYRDDAKFDNREIRDMANKAAIVGNAARIADKKVARAEKRNKGERTIESLKKTQKALHEQYDVLDKDLREAHDRAKEKYGEKAVGDLQYRKNGYAKGSGWYNSLNNWEIGARYNTMSMDNASLNRTVRNFLTGNYQERYSNFTSKWNERGSGAEAARSLINSNLSESIRSLYDQRTRNAAYYSYR